MTSNVKAIALVGFYRGLQLVKPGDLIELGASEFNELRGFQKVDFAPIQKPAIEPEKKPKSE